VLILKLPQTRQPATVVGVSPAWKNAVAFLTAGSARVDSSTGVVGSDTGTINTAPSPQGVAAVAANNISNRRTWARKAFASYDNGYSVMLVANPVSTALIERALVIGDEAASAYTTSTVFFNTDSSGVTSAGRFCFTEYSSAYKAKAQTNAGLFSTGWHVFMVQRPAGGSVAPKLFMDGVDVTSSATAATGVATTSGIHLHGAPVSTSQGYATGGVALACVFNRALTGSEIAALSVNPWQLFAPRKIIIPHAPIGGGYTHPTLSNARMGSLTSTGGVPLVDYAF
jgi:hypothetical protein